MDMTALPLGAAFIVVVAWAYNRHLRNEETNSKPEDRDEPDPR